MRIATLIAIILLTLNTALATTGYRAFAVEKQTP
jgi:hypothetical protein